MLQCILILLLLLLLLLTDDLKIESVSHELQRLLILSNSRVLQMFQ